MYSYWNRVMAALCLVAASAAGAQGIQRKDEPYQVPSHSIPLAAPQGQGAVAQASTLIAIAPPAPTFEVTASDRSVREVLARWAKSAGWFHEPIHWTLDKDHPIQGTAGPEVFGQDFKGAVRKLLSSTELTDRPVQPCFYVNNVVRVIPRAELCDRQLHASNQ